MNQRTENTDDSNTLAGDQKIKLIIMVQYPCTVKTCPVHLYCEEWSSTFVLWAVKETECRARQRMLPSPRLLVKKEKERETQIRQKTRTTLSLTAKNQLHHKATDEPLTESKEPVAQESHQ